MLALVFIMKKLGTLWLFYKVFMTCAFRVTVVIQVASNHVVEVIVGEKHNAWSKRLNGYSFCINENLSCEHFDALSFINVFLCQSVLVEETMGTILIGVTVCVMVKLCMLPCFLICCPEGSSMVNRTERNIEH